MATAKTTGNNARSVSRPAQGRGGRKATAGRPSGLRQKFATPTYKGTTKRSGSLDVS